MITAFIFSIILFFLSWLIIISPWKYFFILKMPYIFLFACLIGIFLALLRWFKSPVAYNVSLPKGQASLNPAIKGDSLKSPMNFSQSFLRLIFEAFTFKTLWDNLRFKVNKNQEPIYLKDRMPAITTLIFHILLLMIFIGHIRYFSPYQPDWFYLIDPPPEIFGLSLIALLIYFVLRRFTKHTLKIISKASDYFPLFLLVNTAATGIIMTFFNLADPNLAREYIYSLIKFSPKAYQLNDIFYLHFSQALILLASLPYSKLIHGLGFWFMPTLALPNNSRAKRHINPNNPDVKAKTYEEFLKDQEN